MSRKGKAPRKYKIRTIQDIADMITKDNFSSFMTDLGKLLEMVIAMKALRDKQVESGKLKPEDAHLEFPEFTWKDGGKHANFINLKLPTGKVKKVNIEEFFKKLENYNDEGEPQNKPENPDHVKNDPPTPSEGEPEQETKK